MTKIEERAVKAVNTSFSAFDRHHKELAIFACIEVAAEQDRIVRAECIKAAQEWLMEYLGDTDRDNPIVESLTKAIEKGGEV